MSETIAKIELPGYIIERTAKRMKQAFSKMLSQHNAGITVDQWVVLQLLEKESGLNQLEIAEKSFKDAPTITRMLDLLEARHFVSRSLDPSDRRKFIVNISEEGITLIKRLEKPVNNFRKKSYAGIDPSKLEQLYHIMNDIFSNLQKM
jgi:DNA-binding MarR family transcriptional regulator